MINKKLSEAQKEKITGIGILIIGVFILLGQIAETRPVYLRDVLTTLRTVVDPIQYMVGMLLVNFILVVTAIKKYEQIPNPFLDKLKLYFAVLFINDFLILMVRTVQKSNFVAIQGGQAIGVGKIYMTLGSVRGIMDLTVTSVALFILIFGLTGYRPAHGSTTDTGKKLYHILLGLVIAHWVFSIPVNLTGFITSRGLFNWSLGLSQLAQLAIVILIYWIVKEYYQFYRTRFFRYLTWYFGITFVVTGLLFTYSMGSFGLLQRFPAGEFGVIGGFGQLVFYVSRAANIFLYYIMYRAIVAYAESGKMNQVSG